MAVHEPWEQHLPKGLSGFKSRDILWVWFYLQYKGYNLNYSLFANSGSRAMHIINTIKNIDEEIKPELFYYRNNNVLPADELSLIQKADIRLLNWISHNLIFKKWYRFDDSWNELGLSTRDSLILSLDLSNYGVASKRKSLQEIKASWSENVKIDQSLKWINEKDEEQSQWLLEKAEDAKLTGKVIKDIEDPINAAERVLKFKAMLDLYNASHDFKKSFLDKLRNTWNAKKYRQKQSKVQCNFFIDPAIKDGIGDLKKAYNVRTQGDVIEKLVKDALKNAQL